MNRLRELRTEKNLQQKEIAHDLNINRTTYCQYENGKREPDQETLFRLADYFNVTVGYLLGRDETNASNTSTELTEYLEELKSRSEMRMLFSLAKGATKEDVEQAVAIIEALRKTKNG